MPILNVIIFIIRKTFNKILKILKKYFTVFCTMYTSPFMSKDLYFSYQSLQTFFRSTHCITIVHKATYVLRKLQIIFYEEDFYPFEKVGRCRSIFFFGSKMIPLPLNLALEIYQCLHWTESIL